MKCKDCVHVEVCRYYTNELSKANGIPLKVEEIEGLLECDDCEHFKDRSRFVELPCEFISKKDLIRELSAQCAVNKIDLETAHDMIKHLPYFRTEAERIEVDREELSEAVKVAQKALNIVADLPPNHGRLIDAKEFKKKLEKHRDMCGDIELSHGIDVAISILNNAPTIIEAEE